jgi:signal transduction histidine kinase/DNA-binding NarL/FixJ family response regulator
MKSQLPAPMTAPEFLLGGGEMGQRIREYDWSKSPLGPVEKWPQSLRTCVRIMLTSRQPIWIGWGKNLIKLYNDPYKDIVRGKHPWALGSPASVVWKDIWREIEPMLRQVMEKDEGTYVESQLLIMERNGYPEETYYTFSYTPIPGDDGGTAGMICANTDDTDRITSGRQLQTLTQLAKRLTDTKTFQAVISRVIDTLNENPFDFPFALFRTVANDEALFVRSTKIEQDGMISERIDLKGDSEIASIIRAAITTREPQVFNDVKQKIGVLPTGAWGVPPEKVVVLPVHQQASKEPFGVLVVALNPYRLFDEKYKSFFSLVADQIATSISNVHALEEERKRAEALAALDKAKTTFFSNISHEFRTPLTLLLAPVEDALSDPSIGPDNKLRMEVAYRNALRMQKLVNTLLEFSRIEAGRAEGMFTRVDIGSFTEDLVSTFRSAIEKSGMRLIVRRGPVIAPVYVDLDMWERILLNLVSNAFKYSQKGKISVDIQQLDGHIQVVVADTGIGIPAHHLERIFDRFHRIENAGGRSQEGTGIGLAMVRELVRLHRGTIDVTSTPGVGSEFTIRIPVGSAHLPGDRISHELPEAYTHNHSPAFFEEANQWIASNFENTQEEIKTSPGKNGQRSKVLLADDNADMRGYVHRLLADLFDVITATDGEDAYQKTQQFKPDLILTDVMMPKLDGFGLLQKVRGHRELKNIPVIFLSARAGDEAKVEGLDAGADDYIVKPFSARELVVRVSNHIRINQVRRETERQFYQLFQEAPAIINIFKGPDFTFEVFHPKNREIFGEVDYTGIPLLEALPELAGQGIIEILQDVYTNGVTRLEKERLVSLRSASRGVSPRYFNYIYQPWYDLKGRIQGVLNFAIDVTDQVLARKQVEEREQRFRNVLLNAPSSFAILHGTTLRIAFANEPMLRAWSRTPEVIGMPLLQALPELLDQPFPSLLDEVLKTGKTIAGHEEKAIIMEQGLPIEKYFSFVYQPIQEADGLIIGVTVMATEVTKEVLSRKKLEDSERKYRDLSERLEVIVDQRTEELRRSNDDLQQFAHVASHDLKEPVRKLKTFINRLETEYGHEISVRGKEYLEKMRLASTRMYAMIEGVLKYSSINETEQLVQQVDLNEVLQSIESDLEILFAHRQAIIHRGLLPTVEGAHILLYQLFYNLINNSLKFSVDNPVIDISSSIVQQAQTDHVKIVVRDNGIGFDQQFADQIFQAFSRLNSKDRFEGTGLGLSLCKKIVERHQGTISASGEENKGSTFTIILPLRQTGLRI